MMLPINAKKKKTIKKIQEEDSNNYLGIARVSRARNGWLLEVSQMGILRHGQLVPDIGRRRQVRDDRRRDFLL